MGIFGIKFWVFSLCLFPVTGVPDPQVQTEGEGGHSGLMGDTHF